LRAFIFLWWALFLALLVTGNWVLFAAIWVLAGFFFLALAMNWRGIADELWLKSIWQRQPDKLTLRLMRVVFGGGGLALVLAGLLAAAIHALA